MNLNIQLFSATRYMIALYFGFLLGFISLFTEGLPVCLCVPYAHLSADAHGDKKRLSVPLDLELQESVTHHMGAGN